MPLFERYVGIDYSGATTSTDSLKGLRVFASTPFAPPREVQPPPSPRRYWTRREIAEWLARELASGVRTLVGIDHGFSFPIKYFEKYQLALDWPAFLDDFQRHWPTDEDNLYVDFIRDGPHGNGKARTGNSKWRRITEVRTGGKSVFHFDCQGSVAKSTHAGIPWLRYLRNRLGAKAHFWPFDGWDPGDTKSVIAEVYPRLWKGLFDVPGLTPDQQDAYSAAAWMRREDQAGSLPQCFSPGLSEEEEKVARIEGWILGLNDAPPEPKRQTREGKQGEQRSEETHRAECHVRRDSAGVAWIDDAGVPVVEMVRLWKAVGENVTALESLLPRLSLGQIHAALGYYFDHRDELDPEIGGTVRSRWR